MSASRPDERGAAAVELAIVLGLLLAVTALVLPLPFALLEKIRLEQAASRTARWATSAPGGERAFVRGSTAAQRDALVRDEALRALVAAGSAATLTTARLEDMIEQAQCPLRRSRTVVLTGEVPVGPLNVLLNLVREPDAPPTLELEARATACEE